MRKNRTFFSNIRAKIPKTFSIEEIEQEPNLAMMVGASLFYFFVSFSNWIGQTATTVETAKSGGAICWAYFKNCADLYFLHLVPYGYSQSALYRSFTG